MHVHLTRKIRTSRWLLVIPFILTAITFYMFQMYDLLHPGMYQKDVIDVVRSKIPGYLIYTSGCRIPDLHPFSNSVLPYYEKKIHYVCSKTRPLIESNQTSIWVVKEAIPEYSTTNKTNISCCYRPFWRAPAENIKNKKIDAEIIFSNECVPFIDSVPIDDEFVKVQCINHEDEKEIYVDYHAFIVPKTVKNQLKIKVKPKSLSVLVIGVDATSRLNMYRQMPKVISFLKSIKAIEFLGYNKVEDNTFPNLVPFLSGYSVHELKRKCWLHSWDFFDNCSWIWKEFSANGYLTAFAEDATWMGMFNFNRNGFFKPPTDYYLRPYIKINDDEIGHGKEGNAFFCDGSRFAMQVLYDYAFKFSENLTHSDKNYWGFFWSASLTHDDINPPADTDDIILNLLEKLKAREILEKTALVFVSDHGPRWGPIRKTHQGRLEERLPFLFIILPDWFKEDFELAVKNMRRNTHLLTTPFDLHETMRDFLNLDNLKETNLNKRMKFVENKSGVSLFLPISPLRTCESAGIPNTWCTCHFNQNISIEDDKVSRGAHIIVEHINDMIVNYSQCARLSLRKIFTASLETTGGDIKTNTTLQVHDYVLTISTEPGNGEFEAVVRYTTDEDTMKVVGFVSRINAYGSQSKCVYDHRMKLYCYCV